MMLMMKQMQRMQGTRLVEVPYMQDNTVQPSNKHEQHRCSCHIFANAAQHAAEQQLHLLQPH
jgi:hypothetical protein